MSEKQFFKMLKDPEAVLVVDNDCCYIYFKNEDREGEGKSFDYGPTDLVFMFAEEMNIEAEMC